LQQYASRLNMSFGNRNEKFTLFQKDLSMKKTSLLFAVFTLTTCILATYAAAQTANVLSAANAQAEVPKIDNPLDISTIPAGATAGQLGERLMDIATFRPTDITSQEQAMAFLEKKIVALKAVAELIVKREDAAQELKDEARMFKLQAIFIENQNDPDKALEAIEIYQKELAEAKSDVLYQAQMLTFQLKIANIIRPAMMGVEGDHIDNFKKFLEEAKTFLAANEFQPDYVRLPMMLLQVSEMLDQDGKSDLQKFVIAELKLVLSKSDSEDAKEVVERMEGLLRFAELPGSEIEFQCILLDGKKLDIKDFRGKVVLIDYWTTWCGPCRMAVPTMKALYDKYHEKGLELIAYSCDDDLDDLKEYEEESPHPWHVASVVMSTESELTDYSTYYGIPGYPTFVLIDKAGKVLLVTHDIDEIDEKLTELF